jgi:hypothetical protein
MHHFDLQEFSQKKNWLRRAAVALAKYNELIKLSPSPPGILN